MRVCYREPSLSVRLACIGCLWFAIPLQAGIPAESRTESKQLRPTAKSPCESASITTASQSDVRAMLGSIDGLSLVKDQYETTAAYSERVTKAMSILERQMLATPVGPRVLFAVPIRGFLTTYDADKGTLTLKGGSYDSPFDTTWVNTSSNRTYAGFVTAKTDEDLGKYVGENSFGVRRDIWKSKSH